MSGEEGGWFYGDSGDPVIRFGMMDRTGDQCQMDLQNDWVDAEPKQ